MLRGGVPYPPVVDRRQQTFFRNRLFELVVSNRLTHLQLPRSMTSGELQQYALCLRTRQGLASGGCWVSAALALLRASAEWDEKSQRAATFFFWPASGSKNKHRRQRAACVSKGKGLAAWASRELSTGSGRGRMWVSALFQAAMPRAVGLPPWLRASWLSERGSEIVDYVCPTQDWTMYTRRADGFES